MKQTKTKFNRCATCKLFERSKYTRKEGICNEEHHDNTERWLANGRVYGVVLPFGG